MPIPFQSNIDSFLSYLTHQKRYSIHTITSYENDLKSFFGFLRDYQLEQLSEIKSGIIRSWLADLKGNQDNSSKTINRKISTLKSFFKYQLKQEVIVVSPMTTIISPKVGKRLPQFVDKVDTDKLFNQLRFADDYTGIIEKLILALLYNTGIRKSELIQLKDLDVDVIGYTIKVLGKGNKERIIPISKELSEDLTSFRILRQTIIDEKGSTPIFLINEKGKPLNPRYVYTVVNRYLSGVTTIDKKSPHILRHTFATHLTNNGADLNAVKELLGHSSLAATQIYTHNSIEKLKDAFKKAHPKA